MRNADPIDMRKSEMRKVKGAWRHKNSDDKITKYSSGRFGGSKLARPRLALIAATPVRVYCGVAAHSESQWCNASRVDGNSCGANWRDCQGQEPMDWPEAISLRDGRDAGKMAE